jgi:hypothetical protein
MNSWISDGCPDNDPSVPRPGRHPLDDHPWNIDPDAYLQNKLYIHKAKKDDDGDPEYY